jgi:hypothetical protein
MSKFLLNLPLQISKALVNSKIQFLIQKSFFPSFRPGQPCGPFGLWPSQPTGRAVPRRPKSPWPAHPARASVASLREIRFPFQFTPSRAGRLSLVSVNRAPSVRCVFPTAPADPAAFFCPLRPPRAARPPTS